MLLSKGIAMRSALTRFYRPRQWYMAAIAIALLTGSQSSAWALITGGEGNDPVHDPGWPEGAAVVFNTKSRIAHWEGPPLGGGQSHAECRGDTAAFQKVLNDFANIEIPKKRLIVHDGVGQSFWLNSNGAKDKKDAAKIDWAFVVWQPKTLIRLLESPFISRRMNHPDDLLIVKLDVYTGGLIDWKKITIPEGIDVDDRRLAAHGFRLEDGVVLEGHATDVETDKPLRARMILERIDTEKGAYIYAPLAEVDSDDEGHWVLKKAPQAWCRLVLTADGYAPRIIGHLRIEDQPFWSEHNSGLAKIGTVSGRVVDHKGEPLAEVDVRLDDIDVKNSKGYELSANSSTKTDEQGRFIFDAVPVGSAKVWIHKQDYVRPGLGSKIEIPSKDVKLVMSKAAALHVKVDFSAAKRAGDYLVHVEPEGGEQVGKWSGDGNISKDDDIVYSNIPPGRYTVKGRPNPGSVNQETKPILIDLKGGEVTELTIKAK